MKRGKRLRKKAMYGPLGQQTLQAILKRELMTNFGFENMGVIADILIERILRIIETYAPERKRLQPYQTLVLAVDKHERFGYGKRMEQCQLTPVFVTLITPKELQALAEGVSTKELRPKIAARILKEAYDQGGVLPFSTLGLLTGIYSATTARSAIKRFYKDNPKVVLPHSGTIFDLGSTLTHKRTAVLLKHEGLLTKEIARRMNHHPTAVDRYLKDDERVAKLWKEGKSVEMISFITGLSLKLVNEYIEIRQSLRQKPKKKEEERPKRTIDNCHNCE